MSSTTPDTSSGKVSAQNSNSELSAGASTELNEQQETQEEQVSESNGATDADFEQIDFKNESTASKHEQTTDYLTTIESQSERPPTKLEEALQLRDKLDSLIRRTVQTKKRCEKLDHDNKYLQDYVGNLMNSGDFLSKRV